MGGPIRVFSQNYGHRRGLFRPENSAAATTAASLSADVENWKREKAKSFSSQEEQHTPSLPMLPFLLLLLLLYPSDDRLPLSQPASLPPSLIHLTECIQGWNSALSGELPSLTHISGQPATQRRATEPNWPLGHSGRGLYAKCRDS